MGWYDSLSEFGEFSPVLVDLLQVVRTPELAILARDQRSGNLLLFMVWFSGTFLLGSRGSVGFKQF
ncbi:MAG TPA: hypothetical protein DEF45_15090 [Rhodopirellula sp.]|nr:hypothetical protein [Rhodopirellula sp.]